MKFLQLFTLIGTLIIASCTGSQEGKLPSIFINGKPVYILKFNDIHDTITLRLSDILDSISFVKLETRDDNKLTRGKWSIGDKYIIGYISRSGFFQFTSNGKYIRKLANYGKGPQEIAFPIWTTSKDEKHLYIYDSYKPKNILCFNLDSGSFDKNIPISLEGLLRNIELVNDSILICAPIINSGHPAGDNYLFWQTLSGKLLRKITARTSYPKITIPSENLLYRAGSQFHYRPIFGDTIFKVTDYDLDPYLILDANKPKNITDHEIGSIIFQIFLESSDFLIIQTDEITAKEMIGENAFRYPGIKKYYYVDKTEMKGYLISNFINDLFGFEEDPISFYDQFSTKKYIYIEATSLLKRINRLKSDSTIKVKDRNKILNLETGTTEIDNPILITGSVKKTKLPS